VLSRAVRIDIGLELEVDTGISERSAVDARVSGDRAYVIIPATYTFKQKGQTLRETAQMTFVLAKEASGWKIHAWTWTGPEAAPVK